MSFLIRNVVPRFINKQGITKLLNGRSGGVMSVRSITGRTSRTQPKIKPAPYNYMEKRFYPYQNLLDGTTHRLDENSKVIIIEGPIASGKTKVAQAIAEEFEMLYFPEVNLDMVYINSYGYDLRKLDPQLPEDCRSFDVEDFLKNPTNKKSIYLQLEKYRLKFSQYIDALAHLFSTGQGVVLDRCAYSDFVFTEAMYRAGYITKNARNIYQTTRSNSIEELMMPHLIVYLDVPVKKIIENVKARGNTIELNSPVINEKYLLNMEEQYKQGYLKEMSKHCELLIYDWSDGGDTEILIEDIERVNLRAGDPITKKFSDWDMCLEEEWCDKRRIYSDYKERLMTYVENIPVYHVPELFIDAMDIKQYNTVVTSAPGEEFERGYNQNMGDKGLLFKYAYSRETLPRTEGRMGRKD